MLLFSTSHFRGGNIMAFKVGPHKKKMSSIPKNRKKPSAKQDQPKTKGKSKFHKK